MIFKKGTYNLELFKLILQIIGIIVSIIRIVQNAVIYKQQKK